jgi:hypothetical protein
MIKIKKGPVGPFFVTKLNTVKFWQNKAGNENLD